MTVFDAPGAGPLQRRGTFVTDINNVGTIVGYYIDDHLVHHGFVRDRDGTFTKLDAPGAGVGLVPPVMVGHPELISGQGTLASSVNDAGTITGYFIDAKNIKHGFLRDKLGTFLTFDVPGSGGTVPQSINQSGEVTGTYDGPPRVTDGRSGAVHGFLRDANGKITSLDVPGAKTAFWEPNQQGTYPQTINENGVIVGWYNQTDGGFIRDARGAYTTFSMPESALHPAASVGEEQITACYLGKKGSPPGPTRHDNGALTTVNPAALGPGRYHGIICWSIADGGRLVGHFGDQERACRGFVRDEHGALTEFDAPCEGNSVAITSVSPLVAGATDSITIKGRHFGSYRPPTDPRERYIVIQASAPDRLCLDDLADDMTRGNVREGALRVARWTDTEIEVTGFSWPAKGICRFHAGDHVTIGVWNAQTGAGPAHYEFTVGSTSKDLTPPLITSVTPVLPGADQTFIIKGQGFGTPPTDYDSDYLDIENKTVNWISRRATPPPDATGFEWITVRVARWTPNEIEVTGFGGAYGKNHWTLNGGDKITVEVWNPQTGAGPAKYELIVVGADQNLVSPRITSLTPMTTRADQTIIIKGLGFGTHPPYVNQTTPYMLISDETANWSAGRAGAGVLNVSRWTDMEIEVTGFGGDYGTGNLTLNGGDQIKVKVWNPQTGAGPGTYEVTIAGEGPNLVAPRITSVTPMAPRANQKIIIKGQGFGTFSPYENNSFPYLRISDQTANWSAGRQGPYDKQSVLLTVSRWTDTEIEVNGFAWAFGPRQLTLAAGDQIKFQVWNAQTGAGPAVITQQIGPAPN